MSTSVSSPDPSLAVKGGGAALQPSAEKRQAKFDLSISLVLASWTALTVAVQNNFGGPDAAEKRDWLAGAISDLLASEEDVDDDYLEEFLIQAMNDNFEVFVDDGSTAEVAGEILVSRKVVGRGDFTEVERMYKRWAEKQKKGGESLRVQMVEEEKGEETDGSEGEEDEEDVEMWDAPQLVKPSKEKALPKVDEEGFVEVVGKRRR